VGNICRKCGKNKKKQATNRGIYRKSKLWITMFIGKIGKNQATNGCWMEWCGHTNFYTWPCWIGKLYEHADRPFIFL
jgi:hypothetical protein